MHTPIDPILREGMVALQGYWEFQGPNGPFDVDWTSTEHFDNYIANFKANAIGQKVPIFDVHNKEEAYGWVQDFFTRPAIDENGQPIIDDNGFQRVGLYAMVEWNSLGQVAVGDKQFLYFSPSFQGEWQNPLTKIVYQDVIHEVSLTNCPYQKYLNALKLSERIGKTTPGNETIELSLPEETEKSTIAEPDNEAASENMNDMKGADMAEKDFEMAKGKKETIDGAKSSKEDYENKEAEKEALCEKDGKLSAADHLDKLSETLQGLADTFKGKEGHGDAKKLASMLKKHYNDLKSKHFPNEEDGDGKLSEDELSSNKKLAEKASTPEKVELSPAPVMDKRMNVMLAEIQELQAFKRQAMVERTFEGLVGKKLIKSGEAPFLKEELIKLSELNDSLISLSEGATGKKSFDLMERVGKIIEQCCHPLQLHTEPKGTAAPQPPAERVSLSEKKLKMTKAYAEENKIDFLTAAAALSKTFESMTE